jgi:autophagy-related protein 2
LLAEIADLDTKFKRSTATKLADTRVIFTFPILFPTFDGSQVVLERMGLRLHLCADTMSAVTAFSGDFASIFKALDEQ